MTADETERLRRLLAALRESRVPAARQRRTRAAGLRLRRRRRRPAASVGAHIVDARAGRAPPTNGRRRPAARRRDAGLGIRSRRPAIRTSSDSARLWGADLFVEALRVADDDDPAPMPSVRTRFAQGRRRRAPVGPLSPVRLSGRDEQLRRVRRVGPVLMAGHGRLATA